MHESIIINCSVGDAIPVDKDWLWMEQIIKDDKASIADVAELVDELYDRDPCIEVRETPELAEDEQPTSDDLLAVASDVFDLEECNRRRSGTYLAKIKIVRSDPDQPYTLRLNVGKVVKTEIITEERSDNYDVEGESDIQLKYPVVGEDIRVSWLNTINGAGPQIKLIGNTAFWGGDVTGTFRIEYTTRYGIVTIEVPGIPNYEGSPLGETQESNLLAFYLYIVYPLTISPPDYSGEPALVEVCGWTDEVEGSGEDKPEPIPEPPPPPEYGCVEESLMLGDPFFYQEYCCDWPVSPNPNACAVRTEPNPGGKTLPQETIEKLTREWPGPIEFIGVGPEGVDGCGKIYYRQKATRKACCDGIEPMVWDDDKSISVMAPGTSGIVAVVGGSMSYDWLISGNGFTLDGYNRVNGTSNVPFITIHASIYACGSAVVRVNDGCSIVRGIVRSTDGEWVGSCRAYHYKKTASSPDSRPVRESIFTPVCDIEAVYLGHSTEWAGLLTASSYEWMDGTGWVLISFFNSHVFQDEYDKWDSYGIPHDTHPNTYAPGGPGDLPYGPLCESIDPCKWGC